MIILDLDTLDKIESRIKYQLKIYTYGGGFQMEQRCKSLLKR